MNKTTKKIFSLFSLAVLLFSVVQILVPPQKASALLYNYQNATAAWINSGQINVSYIKTAQFIDSDPSDTKREFLFSDGCGTHKIVVTSPSNDIASITYSSASQDQQEIIDPSGVTGCSSKQTYPTMPLNDVQNASLAPNITDPPSDKPNPYKNASFSWVNGGVISSTSPVAKFTATSDNKNVFTSGTKTLGETTCYNQIKNVSSDFKKASVSILQNKLVAGGDRCVEVNIVSISISNISAQKETPTYTDSQVPTGTVESASCYTAGIPVFSWMLCPMLYIADGVYGFAKESVSKLLYIDQAAISGNDSSQGLYGSWSVVRNFSSALLVLVALFMIASQVFSFEFMSAYTVKKVLPRLVIAAIAIQLSWFIFTTMIIVMNAIGAGIYGLLTAPFSIQGTDILDLSGAISATSPMATFFAQGGIVVGVAAAIAGTAFMAVAGGAMLTLVLAAIGVIISIAVAILTLVIRKILIIVLLALAPLALVAWILPNTQRFWDMWWKLFSKLLLMFPLIMILFAAGTIGANIIANQSSVSALDYIAIIIVYFAPLFLIPTTFKFAGGMFTSIVSALDKGGSKIKSSGMFGLKDRAKMQKDNSSWSLAKKSRESDRQLKLQQKHAGVMTGSGRYSRLIRGRSGLDDEGRNHAKASSAAVITAANAQGFKDDSALREFYVKKAADEVRESGQTSYIDSRGAVRQLDSQYAREKYVREQIMEATAGSEATIGTSRIMVTRSLQNHTALSAAANKDGSAGLMSYLERDSQAGAHSLADLGSENPEAFSILSRNLPTVSRSDGAHLVDTANDGVDYRSRGFTPTLESFSDLAHEDLKYDAAVALLNQFNSPVPEERLAAVANLSAMARNGAIKTDDLAIISGIVGFDLSRVRSDPNATLQVNAAGNLDINP